MKNIILVGLLSLNLTACKVPQDGDTGPQGHQGLQGVQGEKGEKGDNGVSIMYEVYSDEGKYCKRSGTLLVLWLDVDADGKYNSSVDKNKKIIPICNGRHNEHK